MLTNKLESQIEAVLWYEGSTSELLIPFSRIFPYQPLSRDNNNSDHEKLEYTSYKKGSFID